MERRQKRSMSEDLEKLIKAIGDCKCKSEEDRVMRRAIEDTKSTAKSGTVEKNQTKDFLLKLIYVEMLGHDSNFGHFLAVQACSSSSVMTKLVGYLAVAQFLDPSDSLILLLVNTWRSDLQNENHVVVCAALTAICKLVNADAIGALASQVVSLISHSNELVRKKAVLALQRFCQIDPHGDAGSAGVDIKSLLLQTLSDQDPAVMSATLCGIYELAKINPEPIRPLIPNLTFIVKQVTSHRLSKSYEYHHSPAPFIQIQLLRILALLGKGDKSATDNMKNVLLTVLRNVTQKNTISNAVLFECIRTMTTVSPDTQLLEQAANSIYKFLQSDNSHNMKYMGLEALGGIVSINFRQAQDHQTAVMDCLEDPDDTLRLKTLELLYRMTQSSNVEIVVQKLIQYLKTCSDEHITTDICSKVTELAERFAPERFWYVETMFEMFEAAGEGVPAGAEQTLLQLISEQDTELHKSTVELSLELLKRQKLPQKLLHVVCWVLGEYGSLVDQMPEQNMNSIKVQETLCELLQSSNQDNVVQGYILSAIRKLSARTQGKLSRDAEDLVMQSLSSKSIDLQQRALEIQSFVNNGHLLGTVVPYGGASEDLEEFYAEIESLSFLEGFVQEALTNGVPAYIPEAERAEIRVQSQNKVDSVFTHELKFDPYQAPTVPQQDPVIEEEEAASVVEVQSTVVEEQVPVEEPSIALPSIPVLPAVQTSTLKLPGSQTRRWGPVNPTEAPQEPPVIHVPSKKLQYSQPIENQTTVVSETKRKEEPTLFRQLSDRDVLMGSLFGDAPTDNKPTNGRIRDKSTPKKKSERATRSFSASTEKPTILPELDLLNLSDSKDTTTSSNATKLTEPPADPFAGLDFMNGTIGSKPAPNIDLDALYSTPQNTISTAFAPQTVPIMMTSHRNTGIGMVSGVGGPPTGNQVFAKLTNEAQKDDPFKDLLS